MLHVLSPDLLWYGVGICRYILVCRLFINLCCRYEFTVDQLKSEKTRILTCWKNHINTFHLQITSAKSDISDDFNGNQMLRRSTESVAATWPTSIFTQIRVLAARNFREARPKMLSKLNWLQTIALAIMSGLVWLKVCIVILN